MEWLAGAVVGGLIGLGSALIASEVATRLNRRRRKGDIGKLLRAEISKHKKRVDRMSKTALDDYERVMFARPFLGSTSFKHAAYHASMAELALLPLGAMMAVHRFYERLDKLEALFSARREMWVQSRQDEESADQYPAFLDAWIKWLLECEGDVIEAANEALAELDKLI